jgi:hypothetical protein
MDTISSLPKSMATQALFTSDPNRTPIMTQQLKDTVWNQNMTPREEE